MQITNPTPKYFDMPEEEFNSKLGEFVNKIKQRDTILDNKMAYEDILHLKSKEKIYDKTIKKRNFRRVRFITLKNVL